MANGPPDNLGEDLSAYLDGELSPERTREIERLLSERPAYRAELEALRAVSQQLAQLPRKHAPRELAAGLRSVVEAPRRSISPAPGGRTLRLFVRLSAVAAVLIGGVLVGWQVVRQVPARVGETAVAPDVRPTPSAGENVLAVRPAGPVGGADYKSEDNKRALRSIGYADKLAMADQGQVSAGAPLPAESTRDANEAVKLGLPYRTWAFDASSEPALVVTVTPQTAEQYRAVYAIVAGSASPPTSEVDVDRRTGVAEKETREQESLGFQVVWSLPAAEVTPLVAELKQRAPQQVFVTGDATELAAFQDLAFAKGVWADEIARAPAMEPTVSSPAAGTGSVGIAGGGRGSETARPGEAGSGEKSKEAAKSPAGSGGGRLGQARRPAPAKPARQQAAPAAGGRGEAAPAPAQAPPAASQPVEQLRSVVQRATAETFDATKKRLDRSDLEGRGARGRAAVRSVIAGLKAVAQFLGPPPPRLITVRVRLEPPPATQPAAPAAPAP